MPTIIVNGQF